MAFNIFERWPWTSFQNLNLDWLMKAVKEAVTKADEAATSVGQFDARITQNTNAIEQLGIDLETISSPIRVIVSTELEARYRGQLVTGTQLLTMMQTHGDLPYVEYNGEIYMLDSASTAGDLRFSMAHTTLLGDVTLRHIAIPTQSSNVAYSVTNVGGGGSSGNVFAVTVREQGGEYVADHTYAEIYSQMQDGRIPVLLVGLGSNPTTYQICGMGATGTYTINGQSVACIRFSDPTWLTSNTYNVGVWIIDANNSVDHIASLKQIAALQNVIDLVNDGVSTNALLKTAQTLTAAEQAQVKQNLNITDGSGMFVIPVTSSTSGGVTTYSTTATFAEIMAHMPNLVVRYGSLYYTLSYTASSNPDTWYRFAFSAQEPNNGELDTEWLFVECSNNTVTITAASLDIEGLPDTTSASAGDILKLDANKNAVWGNGNKPRVVIASDSPAIPPLSPNTLYVFTGDAAALSITLTAPANNNVENEYHFIFNSGSTPTTLTIPNTIRQPDGFTVEANHVYEVSILENNMTAQGWTVTP